MIKNFIVILLLLFSFNLFAAEVCGEVTYKDRAVDSNGNIHYTVWIGISDKKYEEFQVDAPIYASVEMGDETCISKQENQNLIHAIVFVICLILLCIFLVGILT